MWSLILSGEADLADVCFLIAVVLAVVGTVVAASAKAWTTALLCAAVAFASLGWLAL